MNNKVKYSLLGGVLLAIVAVFGIIVYRHNKKQRDWLNWVWNCGKQVNGLNGKNNLFNKDTITKIKNGKVVSFNDVTMFSSVALFKAFEHHDLKLNKKIAIVTYHGLTNYPNMYNAVWNGKLGVDYFLFDYKDENKALKKMNEMVDKIKSGFYEK